jgi:hypothetical protein
MDETGRESDMSEFYRMVRGPTSTPSPR